MNKTHKFLLVFAVIAAMFSSFLSIFCYFFTGDTSNSKFSLYAAYLELVEQGEFEGTYLEFIEDYLNVDVELGSEGDLVTPINASLASTVSINVTCYYRANGQSYAISSAGSGVIYSVDREEGDAYIITNYHVICDSFQSTFEDSGVTYVRESLPLEYCAYLYGLEYSNYALDFEVVGYSENNDIAVLKVENSQTVKNSLAQAVTVGNSDEIVVGEQVYLIGNALGYGTSVTTGVISVESEYVSIYASDGVTPIMLRSIRTSATANHGNSGGGLFDADGRLIGILFSGYSEDGAQGINNCLPINTVKGITQSIIENCNGTTVKTKKVTLGITSAISSVTQTFDSEKGKFGVKETVVVQSVSFGSAAFGVLQQGDQLISVSLEGQTLEITREWQCSDFLWQVRAGDTVQFKIKRGGQELTKQINFGASNFSTVS